MTHDQHIASDPAISVWVSASAGTGKTKVLTDRVLRLLLAGAYPSKILCITYTKAAAAEVEQRVEEQLGRWAIAEDKKLQEELTELVGKTPDTKTLKRARKLFSIVLDAPERIRINTIHGFCQSVLKRFPLEADVAPHFTVIDDYTSAELLREARSLLFRESDKSDLTSTIEYFATKISETAFNKLIDDIIHHSQKFMAQDAAQAIKRVHERMGVAGGITEEAIFRKHFSYSGEEISLLKGACAALFRSAGKTDVQIADALQSWLEGDRDLVKSESYLKAFLTTDGEPRKKLCTQDAEEQLSGLKDTLLAEQGRVIAFAEEIKSLRVAVATSHVIRLAQTLLAIYRKLKDFHGYMDFDDIILKTVDLLKRNNAASWVLYKLDDGIDHLLVDEAQDTSPRQWELIDLLTTEFFAGQGVTEKQRTLFVVGDSKQSIFSFQGAEPTAFADMQAKLRKRITASGAEFRNVQLGLSFRSTEPVLQAVDGVFAAPAARDGLIFLESDISHSAHRKGMAGRAEVWPLVETETEALPDWYVPDKQFYVQRPETMLANEIATEIKKWLKDKRIIPSQNREVHAGDIMILVQRRGTFASAMLRALKRQDVPVTGADRLILTEDIAVADCIALANFLLLPQDDLTLATVLKSPLIGLPEEALFELAHNRGEQSLWQRLKENKKFSSAYEFLSELLAKVDYLAPYELFSHVLETLEGRKKLAARLGEEIHDPLNEFLALALQYDKLHTPSLQGFLHWLASGSSEVKRDMEKGHNEVRIMTVHGAKGLQAPIVFLPDTTRLPHHERGILWDNEMPIWSPSTDEDDRHYNRLKAECRLEDEREYRRLLYVAMTRAEDELYVCGWKPHAAVSDRCWYSLVRQAAEGWQEMNGKRVLSSEQTATPKVISIRSSQEVKVSLPQWLHTLPADESISKPLAPSRMEGEGAGSPAHHQKARLRGVLIHRLLQYLPDVAPEKREEVMQRFMTAYGKEFDASEQASIKKELLEILDHSDFASVFSSDSVAEAPVSGMITYEHGKKIPISGQIDRMAVTADEVYIIDYKTSVQVPGDEAEVPEAYIKQMAQYQQLIAAIYPDKTIRCGLLWTSAPKLMSLQKLLKLPEKRRKIAP